MKIGFLVNDIRSEESGYTTMRLACEAANRGHEVFVMGVGDLAYDLDESIRARARGVAPKKYKSSASFLAELQGARARVERISVDGLDVLMLRNVPSDDVIARPWAATIASEFGRMAARRGVIVVNDPTGLAKAGSKMYFQLFPEQVRPRTLISRDREAIKSFVQDEGGSRCTAAALTTRSEQGEPYRTTTSLFVSDSPRASSRRM